ncbi:sterol desaturase family protein [filamentous cyanobacterium LEGE 11480]|uniref:Sterol desaturase family protein n=1 Tax=Romeriopsis navalis LEGE 11480 TaxID=2777977 RepID=A0A928VUW5_9CYAN|nr:sterol desaturase family protein [Romeriopsis navalis]MBE9032669.1 sterol desaturase family protein [Romeriopsis navalis LEGE 11480]
MAERLIRTIVLYLVLTGVFRVLEKYCASIPEQKRWRRDSWLDTIYWFVTPMISQIASILCIGLVVLPIYLILGRSIDWQSVTTGYGPIAQVPLWIQGIIAVVIGDFIGYWTHRLHHTRHLWDVHAVHHSSATMDWLSAVRVHPINDVISRVFQATPVLLLGFSPLAVEMYVPFLSAYVALIHANVRWNYGPIGYLFASPAFHRWHHTVEKEGEGKNFAGIFAIFDWVFGTFYLPKQQPHSFGLIDQPMTESFIGQMIYPVRNWLPRKKKRGMG